MPETDVFGKVQDKLFGSTRQDSAGVQIAEMADARQGVLYFLANTDMIPMPNHLSVGSSALEGMFGKTDFMSDLSSFTGFAFNNTVGRTSIGQTLSGLSTQTAQFATKIDREVSGFFIKVIDKLASFFGKFSSTVSSFLRSLTPTALSSMVGGILSQIPGWNYVKSSSAIYSAFRMAVTNTYSLVSQIWSGWDVKLLGGQAPWRSPFYYCQRSGQTFSGIGGWRRQRHGCTKHPYGAQDIGRPGRDDGNSGQYCQQCHSFCR